MALDPLMYGLHESSTQLSINGTNMTFFLTNITSDIPVAIWTIMPIFSLITLIFGFLGNGFLLIVFIKDRHLRTPFNIYLINLLIVNLACILIEYPMNVVANLYSFKWFMGDSACTVYLYANLILEAVVLNAHQLIAVNRMWAVIHPISYRSHHSVRTAILLCVATWVYVHLAVGPGWIADVLYYRLPVKLEGCLLNARAQPIWNMTIQLLVFDPPLIVMLGSFPVIKLTRIIRRRALKPKNAVAPTADLAHAKDELRNGKTGGAPIPINSNFPYNNPEKRQVMTFPVRVQVTQRPQARHNAYGFFVLAMLTISVAVCWTPYDIYYTFLIFLDIKLPTPFYQVATIAFSCQTMLDPVLFAVAVKSLRDSRRGAIHSHS